MFNEFILGSFAVHTFGPATAECTGSLKAWWFTIVFVQLVREFMLILRIRNLPDRPRLNRTRFVKTVGLPPLITVLVLQV